MVQTSGGRLTRDQRRAQLVAIGLRMLEGTPFHSLSVDDVAVQAGVSRSLLFHYFPTRTDFLAAVVRAAADHVLTVTEVPAHVTSRDRTRSVVAALVGYIQLRRANYVAVIRCAPSVAPELEAVIDEMRNVLCRRVLHSFGHPDPDRFHLLAARIWLSSVEEMALLTADGTPPREHVVGYAVEALHRFVGSEMFEDFFRSAGVGGSDAGRS